MKILVILLVVLFVLGMLTIVVAVLFPSFVFRMIEKILDRREDSTDYWDGSKR